MEENNSNFHMIPITQNINFGPYVTGFLRSHHNYKICSKLTGGPLLEGGIILASVRYLETDTQTDVLGIKVCRILILN